MKFGNLKAALIAASALMAVPALAQTTPHPTIIGTNGINDNTNTATNATPVTATLCKDKLTGEFSRYNCTEKQLPFMGDKSTRKLTIEQIGYLAMGRVLLIERDVKQGMWNWNPAAADELVYDLRQEVLRIERSRKTRVPEYIALNLTLGAK